MEIGEEINGSLFQCERADWGPLRGVVGDCLASQFMWMAEIELDDGIRIHAYKHIETRRYLHLDASGLAFEFRPDGSYLGIKTTTAAKRVFSN